MKKFFFGIAAATIITFAFGSIGCKKSNPISCTEKLTRLQTAAAAYVANDNSENCKAYKAAIQDYVGSCATGMSAEDKANYEAMVADMTCP